MSKAPDYAAMQGGDMLTALGDDATKWAAAFCQIAKKAQGLDIDEGWMTGWFSNAIEHSTDVRGRAHAEPDVSPELRDRPPRERVEAALDKAVRALEHIAARPITESYSVAVANMALRDIAELRR